VRAQGNANACKHACRHRAIVAQTHINSLATFTLKVLVHVGTKHCP